MQPKIVRTNLLLLGLSGGRPLLERDLLGLLFNLLKSEV
jgi:hypothetical protein